LPDGSFQYRSAFAVYPRRRKPRHGVIGKRVEGTDFGPSDDPSTTRVAQGGLPLYNLQQQSQPGGLNGKRRRFLW